jgi:CelD/BcsL family acetyltransferase involved in cellulose biosynthesis
VISSTLEADSVSAEPAGPSVPANDGEATAPRHDRHLRAERRAFHDIPRATWDRLAARNPWATPFSAWAFHCAWWDGYGESAHEQNLVIVDADAPAGAEGSLADPVGIVPLMHRHVVEESDAETHTMIRHGSGSNLTPVAPTAKAIYFGASYHADYATILADPADLPAVADALAEALGTEAHKDPDHPAEWDVVDLRRLRTGDPSIDALAAAFGAREMPEGWTLNLEREEVCPVATLPASTGDVAADMETYLSTLGKKERHEIRRKVRRAEGAGGVRFEESVDPLAPGPDGRTDLDAFIDLHQARWGADGLFPDTAGGAQSRTFIKRLFEEFREVTATDTGVSGAAGTPVPGCPVCLGFLWIGDRRVAASIHFETPDAILYYNAGVDPEAASLSPGVLLVWSLVERALATGRTRLDFLRGDESYKYEWGARDEPIQRILVRREVAS